MVDDNTPTVTARRRKPTRHMRLRMETVKRLRALGAKRKTSDKIGDSKDNARSKEDSDEMPKNAITTRAAKVKKNMLSTAPLAPAKFRKRQVHKTWLPTHIYHAKRAHMTPPREPLWRFSIPLTSTAKSYRPTHRANQERGAIAWDTSYMSCISLEGAEQSIQSLLKALNVGGPGDLTAPWALKGQRWRNGTRTWQGWLYERDMYPFKPIAPVTIIWRIEGLSYTQPGLFDVNATKSTAAKKERRQAVIRVHPSAFLQLWEQVTRLAKIQKPQVVAEDLRFELGSIEIAGPGATEALHGALWPTNTENTQPCGDTVEGVWKALAGVTNAAVLPTNALLSLDISDPRLHHPPRTIDAPSEEDQKDLYRVLADWPCESALTSPGIFDRKRRLAASRALSSQKAINRRKALAAPGSYPDPLPQDPRIPVLLFPMSDLSVDKRKHATWVVLLPWKAVPAVWQSIMYYPLSTGGQVKLGGLREKRQVTFENGVPWFPGDYPGTHAGQAWEALESERRRKEWERRPKGKRVEWSSIAIGPGRAGEIGDGCACDWTHLFAKSSATSGAEKKVDDDVDMDVDPTSTGDCAGGGAVAATMQVPAVVPVVNAYHAASTVARSLISAGSTPTPADSINHAGGLVTIRIELLTRGVASPCARIYRLPAADDLPPSDTSSAIKSLRARWLALAPATGRPQARQDRRSGNSSRLPSFTNLKGASQAAIQQTLAADLLQAPNGAAAESESEHPAVPGEEDLIGFVTTGEFCLTRGKGVAVGSILLSKAIEESATATGAGQQQIRRRRLCIVRNAGETVGRLAEWSVV